jgi:hypothetical protein
MKVPELSQVMPWAQTIASFWTVKKACQSAAPTARPILDELILGGVARQCFSQQAIWLLLPAPFSAMDPSAAIAPCVRLPELVSAVESLRSLKAALGQPTSSPVSALQSGIPARLDAPVSCDSAAQ